MINQIYINGNIVTNAFPKKQFKNGFDIKCTKCDKIIHRCWFDNNVLNKPYICRGCKQTGKDNPCYKKNCWDAKRRLKHSLLMSGNNNPFYGKKHTNKSILKIIKANKDYSSNMSDSMRLLRSRKASIREYDKKLKDPIKYSNQKRQAAIESHKSQFLNHKPNKIEKIIEKWLESKNINYNFSLILGFKQFDFGIKSKKLLIEVDGDYWHGNPLFYNKDGTGGKRKLNNIQLGKIKQDAEKSKWAKLNGFKLIRIWESEVYSGKYKTILNKYL